MPSWNIPPRLMTSRRLVAAALAVTTLGALATACSSSSSSSSSAAASTGSGSAKVTVLRSQGAVFEPLIIAQDQGYFAKEGLDVTIRVGASDTSANVPLVLRGEAQFAMADVASVVKAAANNVPITIVSNLQASTLKTAPSDGMLVRKDGSLQNFKEISGKTIGVSGLDGISQFQVDYAAERAGVNPDTIKFVALPIPEMNTAVVKGQVAGVQTFASFLVAGEKMGLSDIGGSSNSLPGLPQGVLFSTKSYVAQNPVIVKKFDAAIDEAITYANSHAAAVDAIDLKYTELPASYIKNRQPQIYTPLLNTTVLALLAKDMDKFGITTSDPDMANYIAPETQTVTHSD